MSTTTIDNTVAKTIWQQIPIFTKMSCGMRNPVANGNKLTVKVGGHLRWIEITLDPSDTYTVELVRIKRGSYERIVVASVSDVYFDCLGSIIHGLCHA